MTCTPVTPAEFKTARPSFSGVADPVVQSYIDLAQIWSGGEWPSRLCNQVQFAVVCHLMTLDGLGISSESQSYLNGEMDYQSVRSGQVTVSRFRGVSQAAGKSTSDWFSQTTCGRMFLVLLRMNFGGPIYVSGTVCHSVSGYAKDGWWS